MSVFSDKLDALTFTIAAAAMVPCDELAVEIRRGASAPATAVGSGGSATTAAYLAGCRRSFGAPPTWLTTPAEFVLSGEQARGTPIWLFSGSGNNTDILAAFETARTLGDQELNIVTSNPSGELSGRAAGAGARVHLAPTGGAKDGFLATHSLAAAITVLLRASGLAAGGSDSGLADRFRKNAGDALDEGRRRAQSAALSSLKRDDVLLVVQDPRLNPAGITIETSAWEAALCPVQRVDFRNFAHGRHVWASHRPENLFLLALTGTETRPLWQEIAVLLPPSVRRYAVDFADCGRFQNAISVLEALTLVESVGAAVGIDPGKPGVSEFGRELFASPSLEKLARQLTEPIRAKRAAVVRYDPPDAGDHDLFACAADVHALWTGSNIAGLVLDYDGTVVTTADRFEAVRSDISGALAGLLKQGLKLAVATGRGKSAGERMREALPRELRTDVLMGYYNGACVRPLPTPLADEPPDPAPEIAAAYGWLIETGRVPREKIKNSAVQLTLPLEAVANFDGLEADLVVAGHTGLRLARSSHTVDICLVTACKTAVVDALALRWNLAIGSILRVGDSGGPQGNDHALLACELGITVGDVCARPRHGWPLFGPDVAGPDALIRLLHALKPVGDGLFQLNLSAIEEL
jgi:hypothetical protein